MSSEKEPFDLIVSGKRNRRQVERFQVSSLKTESSSSSKRKTRSPQVNHMLKSAGNQLSTRKKANISDHKDKSMPFSQKVQDKKTIIEKKKPYKENKQNEDAPLDCPFYTETGEGWGSYDIDFNELDLLRKMWQLPATCLILWILQGPLRLKVFSTIKDYEVAILHPKDSLVLEDVMTKLLLEKSERFKLNMGIGLPFEWWNRQLVEYFNSLYTKWDHLKKKAGIIRSGLNEEKKNLDMSDDSGSEEEEDHVSQTSNCDLTEEEWLELSVLNRRLGNLGEISPLKNTGFDGLSVEMRVMVLLDMCEAAAEDQVNASHLRMMEEDDLRVEPLGTDRAGNAYYYFPQFYQDRRIYKVATQSGNNNKHDWSLWSCGYDSLQKMLGAMKSAKRLHPKEKVLQEHIENILAQYEEELEENKRVEEREKKRVFLESLPRKRSARLQVKQVADFEESKTREENEHQRRQLEIELARRRAEEAAAKKKEDALMKIERQKKKDEEKILQEEREREDIKNEREERRYKRLRLEEEARLLELQEEENRKKLEFERQQERELRAQRRQIGFEFADEVSDERTDKNSTISRTSDDSKSSQDVMKDEINSNQTTVSIWKEPLATSDTKSSVEEISRLPSKTLIHEASLLFTQAQPCLKVSPSLPKSPPNCLKNGNGFTLRSQKDQDDGKNNDMIIEEERLTIHIKADPIHVKSPSFS